MLIIRKVRIGKTYYHRLSKFKKTIFLLKVKSKIELERKGKYDKKEGISVNHSNSVLFRESTDSSKLQDYL